MPLGTVIRYSWLFWAQKLYIIDNRALQHACIQARPISMYGGSVRVWANAWDLFRRTPSRGGRGRRSAVELFRGVFFQRLVAFRVFFSSLSFLQTHTAYCKCEQYLASCTSLLVIDNRARQLTSDSMPLLVDPTCI